MSNATLPQPGPVLHSAEPQLFVTDIERACAFFTGMLGFEIAFVHGDPAFYAQVFRGGARLNLRHVDAPLIDTALARREDYLAAVILVDDADRLYETYRAAGATFHQSPRTEPWGARTFIVEDSDGNLILFSSR